MTWDPGNKPCLESWDLGPSVNVSGGLRFTRSRRSNQTLTEKKNNSVPTRNPLTCQRRDGAGWPQSPASAFVCLNGGDPGVINIRSATWDCFLPDAAERNMKRASDGHQAISAPPPGPFTAFKSFYSSSLFFVPKKTALMRVIPGSLQLWWSTKTRSRNPKIKLQTCQLWCIRLSASKMSAFSFSFTWGVWNSHTFRGRDVLAAKFCLYQQKCWSGSWSLGPAL